MLFFWWVTGDEVFLVRGAEGNEVAGTLDVTDFELLVNGAGDADDVFAGECPGRINAGAVVASSVVDGPDVFRLRGWFSLESVQSEQGAMGYFGGSSFFSGPVLWLRVCFEWLACL